MWVKTLYPQWTSRLMVIPYTTWLVGFDPYPYIQHYIEHYIEHYVEHISNIWNLMNLEIPTLHHDAHNLETLFFTHGAVCGWSLRDRLPSRRLSWLEAPTWSQPKTSGVQAVTVLGLNSYWRWWKQQLWLLYIYIYIYLYIPIIYLRRLLRGARTAWAVRRSTRWSCRQGRRWNNLLNIHTKGSWKSLPSATFHVYATSCWQTLTVWVEAAWVGCSESRLKIKEVQICC